MISNGLVREVKDNKALVRFIKESACGGKCASCGGCGVKPIDVWIDNTLSLVPGERVEVKSPSSKILLSAFITYIFPLLAFMFAYVLFANIVNNGWGLFSGVIGFFLSFLVVRLYGKKLDVTYKMLKRID